jgi:hypothetical protein
MKTKPRHFAGLSEAAEGIRTLDLLHGKQSAPVADHPEMPANRPISAGLSAGWVPRIALKSQGFSQGTDNQTDTGRFAGESSWATYSAEGIRLRDQPAEVRASQRGERGGSGRTSSHQRTKKPNLKSRFRAAPVRARHRPSSSAK